MLKKITGCAVLVALLVALGCNSPEDNSGDSETTAGSGSTTTANDANKGVADELAKRGTRRPRTSTMPAVGSMAPALEGIDTDGELFSLADYRGKVVMLDFWGNW